MSIEAEWRGTSAIETSANYFRPLVTVFEWICIKYKYREQRREVSKGEYIYRIKSNTVR
jgi:hypothetical protein